MPRRRRSLELSNVTFPGFVGLWFAVFPKVEGIVAQVGAAALVIGSYLVAEQVRVRRPRRLAAARATAEA